MEKDMSKITRNIRRSNRIALIFVMISFLMITGMFIVTKVVYAEEKTPESKEMNWPEAMKIAMGFLSAAIATGVGSYGAGKAVSTVGSAAIGAISEKPEIFGRSLVFVGLAEGIAIYGLLISILILMRL